MPDIPDVPVITTLEHLARHRLTDIRIRPELYWPWWRPVTVKLLLVTDGLDFGDGDFGLSAFVTSLLDDGRGYVRFDITLGHLRATATDQEMLVRESRISRRIKGFRFDVATHFTPTSYDEVWLFGVETSYKRSDYGTRNTSSSYPADRLSDAELTNLTAHMNGQRGLFATGDHGSLGAGLGKAVDRARNMRHWADFGSGEVSMGGPHRNDSNTAGHDWGHQFSDQSDDVPQRLDLKLYATPTGGFREERYPHPILCSPTGRIDVFPDHPHEGEVRVPPDLGLTCRDGSPEYPPRADGSGQEVPEVIASGRVAAGNTASAQSGPGNKMATVAHGFGVLCAYDGHRASVGRVVTDSTWHHFVNVNLIGILEGEVFDDFDRVGESATKHVGFLSSPQGREVLKKIQHYYVNTAVWLAPPSLIRAMNDRIWWDLVWSDRLVEATMLEPATRLEDVRVHEFYEIGSQARDVLGRRATVCRSLHFVFPWLDEVWEELVPWVNPWDPVIRKELPELPWIDPGPLVSIALGGALVALREAYPYPTAKPPRFGDEEAEIVRRGMATALAAGVQDLQRDLASLSKVSQVGAERLAKAGRSQSGATASAPAKTSAKAPARKAPAKKAPTKKAPTKKSPGRGTS